MRTLHLYSDKPLIKILVLVSLVRELRIYYVQNTTQRYLGHKCVFWARIILSHNNWESVCILFILNNRLFLTTPRERTIDFASYYHRDKGKSNGGIKSWSLCSRYLAYVTFCSTHSEIKLRVMLKHRFCVALSRFLVL